MMQTTHANPDIEGAVMVVGGGIAGIQAALDLADGGFLVYLIEKTPEEIRRKLASINRIINTIKPVHTTHFMEYSTPTLRIGYKDGRIPASGEPALNDESAQYGDGSVVGFSTLIGGR